MVDDRGYDRRQTDLDVATRLGRIEGILEQYTDQLTDIFAKLDKISGSMQQIGLVKQEVDSHSARLAEAERKVAMYQVKMPILDSLFKRMPVVENKVVEIELRDKKRVWTFTGGIMAIGFLKAAYDWLTKH